MNIEELKFISRKLSNKLKRSCRLNIEVWKYNHSEMQEVIYHISLVPGFNGERCTHFSYKTREEFIKQCNYLVERKSENEKMFK